MLFNVTGIISPPPFLLSTPFLISRGKYRHQPSQPTNVGACTQWHTLKTSSGGCINCALFFIALKLGRLFFFIFNFSPVFCCRSIFSVVGPKIFGLISVYFGLMPFGPTSSCHSVVSTLRLLFQFRFCRQKVYDHLVQNNHTGEQKRLFENSW